MGMRFVAGACALAGGLAVTSMGATVAVEDFGRYGTLESSPTGHQGRIAPNGFEGNPISGQVAPDPSVSGIHNWISSNVWGANRVVAGDLSYPGYISSGGKRLQAYAGGTLVRAVMDTSAPTVFSSYIDNGVALPAIGKTGTTLYVSFLYRIDGTTTANSQAVVNFHEQTTTTATPTFTSRSEFGQTWGNANIRSNSTVLEAANNTTHLAVFKIVYNGTTLDSTDSLTTWYDPNLSLSEASQTIDATSTRNMTFTHMTFNGQGSTAVGNTLTKLEVDDIRFGTSWADVVPVPEPGIATLASSAALLLVRKRKH